MPSRSTRSIAAKTAAVEKFVVKKFIVELCRQLPQIAAVANPETTPPRTTPSIPAVPGAPLAQLRRLVLAPVSWRQTFAALRHRNYRLFFWGQLVSLIGTWMQQVAQNWLVYQLTKSALTLGFINFLSAIPITILTLPAGVIADRHDKRRILIATQTASMLLAFILAALVYCGVARVWHIAVLSLLLGITNAFDVPTRQSFVVEMAGKDDLMNAIALNSSMFNGARVFGPALAGMLIGWIGMAGCFLLNGLSFLAVIFGYLAMRFPAHGPTTINAASGTPRARRVSYVRHNRIICAVMILVAVVSMFGWSYSVLLPVFPGGVLHVGARGYGLLLAANGIGALVGALTLASLGNYPHRRRLVFGGLFGFCGMIVVFALSHNFWLSAAALVGAGFFMIIFFATANTSVQMRTPDELRGRVMGSSAFAFLGINPFGSMLAGAVAHASSAALALWLGTGICAVAALVIARLVRPSPQPPPQPTTATSPPSARSHASTNTSTSVSVLAVMGIAPAWVIAAPSPSRNASPIRATSPRMT